MLESLAIFRGTLIEPDDQALTADLAALQTIAHQLDASTFRVAYHVGAAQRAAAEDLAGALDEVISALPLLERASSSTAQLAIWSAAWFGALRGDRAAVVRAADTVRELARDWGALTPTARALAQLPALLDGETTWQGPLPVVFASNPCGVVWLWNEIAGDQVISTLGGHETGRTNPKGDVWELTRLRADTQRTLAAGRYQDAEPAIAELVRARNDDQHLWLLALARCAADAGHPLDAARLLGAVAAHQERAGAPWLPRMLRTAWDQTQELARTTLGEQAFAATVAEGRALDLQDAVAYARRARGERKRPASGWDSLTPTELQVAEQVAAGRTNAEIAATLLMGRTTVKTHLAHIFTKLGYTNRSELAAETTRRASAPTRPSQ
jgi:DNA-binding CsgD family transcriptional regulator